ncbi:MAG: homoserine O-acetyltransferase [Candidatus Omnitrophica bacterium]|nr:homoserine O-acetyltransferase [Candidatus Omnitrophota bacterium]
MNNKSIIETQYYTFAEPPGEVPLKCGQKLGPITQAYETYGELNADKSNAILVFHALTGDAHAAGYHKGADKPGWWDNMIGSGKAFDTDKYFVICANVLGSCKGTTGPASIDPKTKKPYALTYPMVTIEDMTLVQKYLIDHLGIEKLLCCVGGSMGGLLALKWTIMFPDAAHSAILIATNYRHTAQQIALHEVARQAIISDPHWNNGNYYGGALPATGLSLSRMIAHITYMSEESMEKKFGRKLQDKETVGYDFKTDFEVESYLKYRGSSFVDRFDANSYLYLSKALDYFDLCEGRKLSDVLSPIEAKFLIITFSSDWLYPSYQSRELVRALKTNDVDVSYLEIESNYGHDAFLVETESQARLISSYLKRVWKERVL